MKTSILLNSSPATGPHLDQVVRDRLDDFALTDTDMMCSNGAMHAEAVTAA